MQSVYSTTPADLTHKSAGVVEFSVAHDTGSPLIRTHSTKRETPNFILFLDSFLVYL